MLTRQQRRTLDNEINPSAKNVAKRYSKKAKRVKKQTKTKEDEKPTFDELISRLQVCFEHDHDCIGDVFDEARARFNWIGHKEELYLRVLSLEQENNINPAKVE